MSAWLYKRKGFNKILQMSAYSPQSGLEYGLIVKSFMKVDLSQWVDCL
jgi:hypothetical protein